MNNYKLQYLIPIGMLCVLISGCGSSNDSSAVTMPTTPTVTNSDPTGVWEGTFTENGTDTFDLVGIVEDDKVILISDVRGLIYVGTMSVSGTSFTATPTNYVNVGSLFSTANLSGSVTTKSTLSGTFSLSTGTTISFSLTYDPITDRGSSLAIPDGNWTETYAGVKTVAISVDSTGAMTGSNTDGCVYLGMVGIIDPAVNIYSISVNVSSCGSLGLDGTYAGYIVMSDTVTANDTIIYFVDNPNNILSSKLIRT